MEVSIFKNFNEVVQNSKVVEVLNDIKTGKYINVITYLRKSLAESKMEAYERAKKSLPAFTPSASFKGGRKLEFVTAYTQIVVLDIDKLTKEQLTNAKALAIQNQSTFAAFTSPSGNGLKIFVRVNSLQENHKEAFLKLQKYYEELLTLPIDKSGKDVTRLCFVSYDTDLFLNENASIFPIISTEDLRPYMEQKSEPINESITIADNNFAAEKFNNDYLSTYEHCVRFTEKKESFITGNRNNFVHLLACNLNRKGVPLPAAMGFILSDYNYNTQEVMATVNSAYKNVTEYNKNNSQKSVDAIESEESEEEEKPSFIDRLENFLNNRYNFRYNTVTGKLEYKTVKSTIWKPVTDFVENSILREILKAKVKCNINTLRNLLHSDYCQQYDPFKDYFETLPENEDETDYITELANTITTTKQDLWQVCFKKWFVAMVACVTNEKVTNQTVIVFSGKHVSGLTLAYLLAKQNIKSTVLEASPRLGGRIQTIKGSLQTPLELGATWFSDMHPHLLSLIDELGLKKYPQFSRGISLFQTKSFEPPQKFFVPEAEIPSYRVVGGTQMLIDTLAQKLPSEAILLNTKVTAVKETGNGIILETADGKTMDADQVVVCIPPQLVAKQIVFSPELPDALETVLLNVQTWMAGAIKFTLEYGYPFWRHEGYSGMLYSHAGIIMEMYDHTNFEENKFGFTGFLSGGAATYPQQVRRDWVLRQLSDLLGAQALKPTAYFDKVWTDEFILDGNQVIQRPHQYNGHPLLQESYMHGKLFFAATETATKFPGYMEGAVVSALKVAGSCLSLPPHR